MIRLGIIGTDSTHAEAILKSAIKYDQVSIEAIYGESEASAERLLKNYNLSCPILSPQDMIGKVDGVMITLRDGTTHLKAVRPLFGHDIALWIDKPFTVSVPDASELVNAINQYNIPYSGGSCVKMASGIQKLKQEYERIKTQCLSGYMSFQIKLDSPYSGIHFYSHHLIECVLEVFGCGVQSVLAKRSANSLAAIVQYHDFHVILNFGVERNPIYGGVFGTESSFMTEINLDNTHERQFEEFLDVIKTGRSPYSTDFFLTAVKVSNAIEQSLQTKKEIQISTL